MEQLSSPDQAAPPDLVRAPVRNPLKVLLLVAFRSLFSHKVKTLIVGSIMLFGTFLVVLGTALLDSIERSMQQSITSSVSGHLQVYDSGAKDKLALFGGMAMGSEDVGRIADFRTVKEVLTAVPEVKAVIPMGIDIATATSGNEVDRLVNELREVIKAKDEAKIASVSERIRGLIDLLINDHKNRLKLSSKPKEVEEKIADLERAKSDEFWAALARDPEPNLEFLDTHVAPLSKDGWMTYFRYLGTDVDKFAQNFDKFEIVEGEMIPKGKRGFLFNKRFYEEQVKNKVARNLDYIYRQVVEEKKSIADTAELRTKVGQNARQYRWITFQVDPSARKEIEAKLRAMFPKVEGDFGALVQEFLNVDDSNIRDRYKLFYELIAPKIRLYEFKVGDTMTVRSYTRSGYLKSLNVKIYGAFKFRGLERSDLAGGHNLIDMMTFRDLYGLMTPEGAAELAEIKKSVAIKDVGRAEAEDALFGGDDSGTSIVSTSESKSFDSGEAEKIDRSALQRERDVTYSEDDIEKGLALNAAVILKDPRKLRDAQKTIQAAIEKAGLKLQVVDWQTASGIVGQFVLLIRLVLYIAILIIFLVALVIINNSMVTATMERTAEIGTMRAIGAQRGFVMRLFLIETIILGTAAGALGAGIGILSIVWLKHVGLAAPADVVVFMFGGPRLYPDIGAVNVIVGVVIILFVSVISTLYPARIATRIQPVVAMQTKE